MENYGLKIAKEGKNAFSIEKLDILFNSQKSALKIIQDGTSILAVPSTGSRVYIAAEHRLGFTPAFLAYVQLSNASKTYPISAFSLDGGEDIIGEVNNDVIRFGILPNGSTGFTAYIQWYLLANRIDA